MDPESLAEFELLVMLAAVRLGPEEAYTVPIAEDIRQRTGRSVRRANVYTTLQRLEAAPVRTIVFVPARDCEIIDTWDTGGLRGTGSHDFQITDVLVPERRTFAMGPFARTEHGDESQREFGALTGVEASVVGLGID